MGFAIVTGAAGGMGRPAATRFAGRGDDLLLCDLNADALDALAATLRAEGVTVDVVAGDVSAPDFIARLLEKVGERPIDALVHTAGLSPSMSDAARIFEINYHATERLVDAVRPRIAEGGCAVLISSSSAYMMTSPEIDAALDALVNRGDAGPVRAITTRPQSAYPISKKAVIALVAREATPFGARGARIASIAPGFIDTEMGRTEMRESQQMVAMIARTPLARLGSGDEIASVALFLCSPEAAYVSGCDIKVDGGALAALGF